MNTTFFQNYKTFTILRVIDCNRVYYVVRYRGLHAPITPSFSFPEAKRKITRFINNIKKISDD